MIANTLDTHYIETPLLQSLSNKIDKSDVGHTLVKHSMAIIKT